MNTKEETDTLFRAVARAIDQVWLNTCKNDFSDFAQAVREFRQVEADFAGRAGDDEFFLTEMRRRIAESILSSAHSHDPPFEACRDAWNDLLHLGFSTLYTRSLMTGFYADCCRYNQQYDVGLAVLEPLIADFEQRLADGTGSAEFGHQQLACLKSRREALVAHQTSEAAGIAWQEREDAKYDAHDVHWMEREGRNQELDLELDRALDSIGNASWSRSFAETAHDYRQLKADFVARLQGDDAFFVPEAKRRISATLLMDAQKHHQPFEMCRELWDEIVECGFASILQECALAWFYADCCLVHGQADEGLAALEPRIAKLQEHDYAGLDTDALESFQEARARLEKLRDRLKAAKT